MKKKTDHKNVMVCLMLIMFVQAIRYFPFEIGEWNQLQLSFSYEYGFIQRAFVGTVLDLMSRIFHIPWGYMRYVHGILAMGIFTFLMLFIVYRTLESDRIDSGTKNFLTGLSLVFFMGPGWSTNYSHFGLLVELWIPLLSILGIYLLVRGKMIWCVPVICIICELIHTAYVFLYFNLILVVFFYKIFIDRDSEKRRYTIYGIAAFVLTSIMFIYMMFFATTRSGITVDYVLGRMAEFVGKSAEQLEGLPRYRIQGYLFRNGGDSGILLEIKSYWLILIVMLVMFSPFIYEVCRYWRFVVKQGGGIYALIPCGIVTAIPIYIMHSDYGRWTYAVFFYEFACIWLLNVIHDEAVVKATTKMMERITINKVYYLVLLFYAGVSGAFSQNLINPMVSKIESYGWKVLQALGL